MAEQEKAQLTPDMVEGFPVNNPKAKIVKDRDHIRVVERQYYWDKSKARGLEKRKYLGYIVDRVYYDNATYLSLFKRNGKKRLVPVHKQTQTPAAQDEAQSFIAPLETRLACEFPLYWVVAKDIGLLDDLSLVWGEHTANAILSIAFHWMHTAHNAAYLYESWSPGKLLPLTDNIPAKEMTEFFDSLLSIAGWRKTFFQARVARLPENEMLSFDATEIATDAQEISYAQYGKGKEGGYQKQVGLIVLMGHRSKMPVLFRVLPGNITDVSTVSDMLFRFDEITDKKRVFAAVLDRGYCSLDNIARFIDQKSRVIIATKTNIQWVRDGMEAVLPHLWMAHSRIKNKSCWGHSVPIKKAFSDGKTRKFWLQVYRSDSKSHIENENFFKTLDKFECAWNSYNPNEDVRKTLVNTLTKNPLLKYYENNQGKPGIDTLVRNHSTIDEATRFFGCFCNVTTFECSPTDALVEYATRDVIEKGFKAGKSNADMSVLRAHSDETSEGRFIIGFCCMSILTHIYAKMNKYTYETGKDDKPKEIAPLIEDMTFNEVKNYLHSIRLAFDGKGQRRWLEVTNKQHMIAKRLGYPDLYKKLPDWGPR